MINLITEPRYNTVIMNESGVLLVYLQIMTSLNAFIPISLMLDMFQTGIESMCRPKPELVPEEKEKPQENDAPVGNGSTSAEQTETSPPRSSAAAAAAVADEEEADDVPNLKCFNLMLELLLNQVAVLSCIKLNPKNVF